MTDGPTPFHGLDPYQRLLALVERAGARYRLIDHPPEGRTPVVSAMRGNELSQAAKCIVLMVKQSKKVKQYVLAVVPGDAHVDLEAVKRLFGGTYVAFASKPVAEALAGSVTGTVLPFALHPDLELVADPSVLDTEELFFNAARLDQSMALATNDYVELATPRLARIREQPADTARLR